MPIIIVSGLPRSGTSLMMQMLQAGGLEILADHHRPADADNPRGYFEYEPVKALARDNSWLPKAEGQAVKVISALLTYLPPYLSYKIILMKRPLVEVLASQKQMLQRLGRQGSTAAETDLGKIFARQLAETERRLGAWDYAEVLVVHYHQVLQEPEAGAGAVAKFLGLPLDISAMSQAVDPSLYRQRLPGEGNR
jgi:Sulfotransferase domain